jgi:hypothetical protein
MSLNPNDLLFSSGNGHTKCLNHLVIKLFRLLYPLAKNS